MSDIEQVSQVGYFFLVIITYNKTHVNAMFWIDIVGDIDLSNLSEKNIL